MLLLSLVNSAAILAACLTVELAAWPLRRFKGRRRWAALLTLAVVAALLPTLQPAINLWLRIIVCLTCPVMAVKLIDLHVGATYWRQRRLREWFWYLVFPFILVPRISFRRSPKDRRRGLRKLPRAAVEIAAGLALLWGCYHIDWRPLPFLVEHTARLTAAYLVALDGMFIAVEAAILLCGFSMLPLTGEPIAACTPADFWRRYNCEAGRFLRENVFRPIGGACHPVRGIAAAFAMSAVLHEYISWLLTGHVYGFQFAYFGLQAVAVAATYRWRPTGAARWIGILGTLLFEWATAILFFENVNRFCGWYAAR